MQTGRAMLVILLALAGVQLARSEHALSEVWSESDGLQLKYSTNHDDLLSTKGSELSLASQQRENAAQGASAAAPESEEAVGQQQSSDEQAEGARSGSTASEESSEEPSEGGSSSADTEQGADSSSRLTNQVPLNAIRQVTGRTGKFSEPAARFRSAIRSDETDRSANSRLRSTSDAIRFSSALDMADQLAGEVASAEPGADTSGISSDDSDSQLDRYRAAPKMSQLEAPREEANNAIDADVGPSTRRFNRPQELRGRQGMIEFERISSGPQEAPARSSKPHRPDVPEPVSTAGDSAEDGERDFDGDSRPTEEPGKTRPESKLASEDSDDGESGDEDASAAASAAHRATKKQQQQQASSDSNRPQAQAYFRGAPSQVGRKLDSPDNVRDDFISPGHFPGSMAHLTQAASELKQVAGEQQAASRASPTAIAPSKLEVRPEVTPEPEAQPESQQIMAPVLLSTTTMAPMVATSSTTEPALPSAADNSTQAPTLKRFKFRKYR